MPQRGAFAVMGDPTPHEFVGDTGAARRYASCTLGVVLHPRRRPNLRLPAGQLPLKILTALLVALALAVFSPLLPAIIFGAFCAIVAHPLVVRLQSHFRGQKRVAVVVTLLLVSAVVVPFALVAIGASSAAADLWKSMQTTPSAKGALEQLVQGQGEPGAELSSWKQGLQLLREHGASSLKVATTVLGAGGSAALQFFVAVVMAYTYLAEGETLTRWIVSRSPLPTHATVRLGEAFAETGRGMLVGMGGCSLAQSVAATLAYLALGVPRPFLLGALTFVTSLIPSVGTALVWGPLALGLGLTGHWGKAAIMVALGVLVIGTMDNLLRPVFAKRAKLNLPSAAVLFAIFGGLVVFGGWGILLGPLAVRLAVEALDLLRERGDENANSSPPVLAPDNMPKATEDAPVAAATEPAIVPAVPGRD